MMLTKRRCRLAENRVRTQRGKVHQAREGDYPVVLGVDDVAAVELEDQPT